MAPKKTTAPKKPAAKPAKKPAATKPAEPPTSPAAAAPAPDAVRPAPAPLPAAEPVVEAPAAKPTKPAKEKPAPRPKRMSGLDAAHLVLRNATVPMRTVDIMAVIQAKSLWKTHGKTPEQTLYAAIIREISAQGEASRFVKAGKGLFSAAG